MADIVIELPENLKSLETPIRELLTRVAAAVRSAGVGKAVSYSEIEHDIAAKTAAVEVGAHEVVLGALEIDSERIRVGGERYTRVGRFPATYRTLAGPVVVTRGLYRQDGVRNGKTVDVVSLRTGAVANGWLPAAARAMGLLVSLGTPREAESAAREMGRLMYSRSSFERITHVVGELYIETQTDVDAVVRAAEVVPEAARSVSVSMDRVSMPMEEPRPRPVGRPKEGAPKRPAARVFRMAYCATLTFHDERGEALRTIRHGCMPAGDALLLCMRLADELRGALAKRPDLQVVVLADGAPELWNLLDAAIATVVGERSVHRLIDEWHLLEKLGAAARVIHDDEAEANERVRGWHMRLMNSRKASQHILGELRRSRKRDVSIGAHRPVHEAITYIENNRDRMNYADARRLGLPIGSGVVEATCKSLVAQRMKRAGSRWHDDTGEHILRLRALLLSDRWDDAMPVLFESLAVGVRRAA